MPIQMPVSAMRRLEKFAAGVVCAIPLLLPVAGAAKEKQPAGAAKTGSHITAQLNGSIPVKAGQRLHLATDLGNVVIHTQETNQVDYRVRLETDSAQKDAKALLKSFTMTGRQIADGVSIRGLTSGCQCRGRLWVTV